VEFSRSAFDQLYVASDGPRAGTVLYLLPKTDQDCPPTIDFVESWTSRGGSYVFLAAPIPLGGEKAFAEAAWAFMQDPRMQGTRFAWFEPLGESGLLTGTAIQVYQPTGTTWATSFPVAFPFRNVGLSLAANAAVEQDDAAVTFTFAQQDPGLVQLTAGWGGVTVGTVRSGITLPFTGPTAGCLQLQVDAGKDDLDALDVGLRWFYAIPPDGGEPGAGEETDFFLASLRYPVLKAGTTLSPNLDPLVPLDGSRTYFGLAEGTVVSSAFNETMGDAFSLVPQSGAALVFAENRQASTPSEQDPLYLVPSGDFELRSDGSTAELMCGLSGVEYVAVASPKTVVSFVPGQDSFAAGFIPGEPPGATSLVPAVSPTTSFASVSDPGAGVGYYAQPDQSVLYNYAPAELQPPPGTSKPITTLSAVPVLAATFQRGPAALPVFPLLPYGGLGGQDPKPFRQLESQVVSPLRRNEIASAKAPALPGPQEETLTSRYSTTPQGLLATYAAGAQVWDEVVLAQMPAAPQLLLQQVQGPLLTAFQSNKLFLVASNPESIEDALKAPNAEVAVGPTPAEAWTFDLSPESWAEFGTILILKFYDASIEDLARDTSSWASPGDFNVAPDETAKAILDAIEQARRAQDPDLQTFLDAMTRRDWNGIIALDVKAPLKSLPAQLAGLAVGIDQSRFKAHHVGIQASKITVPAQPGDLGIEDSSIFGLIRYQGPPPAAGLGDFAFAVEELKVLFLSSAVASFSSTIDLEINNLFGEPAALRGDPSNVVRLYGVYQKYAAGGGVQDAYAFQTKSGESSVFDMTSQVLRSVVLSRGQFVTVTAESTTAATDSQFVFWGLVDFKALTPDPKDPQALPFDVFSFGSEQGATEPAGLSFGNLAIGMRFDPNATPPFPIFVFDATKLSLDVATSKAREQSLFRHFPLTLAGFTQGEQGATPTSLGYMGLQTPLAQSSLEFPWFSLSFDLNLGSAGALAAEAGFVAGLTVAWSPTAEGDYAVFTGLKLPGSNGDKRRISIEGIFDIGFKSLQLVAVPETKSYVLVIYGIGFKFLSLTFPPSGQVNFVLFGDPTSTAAADTSLGWYAAYSKDQAQGKAQALALRPTRGELPPGGGGG
jgi:hypothetical protein